MFLCLRKTSHRQPPLKRGRSREGGDRKTGQAVTQAHEMSQKLLSFVGSLSRHGLSFIPGHGGKIGPTDPRWSRAKCAGCYYGAPRTPRNVARD